MTDIIAERVTSPARLAALARTALLDSDRSERFDRLTRLASLLLDVPVSLVSLVDTDRQFFKSQVGLAEPWASARETPLTHSFCQIAVAFDEALVVTDARADPRVRDNLAIEDLGVIAYCGIPLTTPEGHPLGAFCVIDSSPRAWEEHEVELVRDLAALALTEIQFSEAMAAAGRRQGGFDLAATLAHDLRGMLAGIVGAAGTLRSPRLSEAMRDQLLEVMERQADQLATLMEQLLQAGRIESGRVPVTLEAVDVGALVRSIVAGFTTTGVDRISTAVDDDLVAHADPSLLQRVVMNLVDNALKYGGAGPVRVAASTDDEGRVVVAVSDEGDGIAADQLEHIFERYAQADHHSRGAGLGLHIVRSLMDLMGGSVAVVSEVGRGSTFAVTLAAA